ncbi:MAG: GGDEF domain-containing protein [Marmoricola sp.]
MSFPFPRRRSSDGVVRAAVARVAGARDDEQIDPVYLGRVLVLVTEVIVASTVPLLDADGDAWLQVGVISAALLVGFLASFAVPWRRITARATLAFPTTVCGSLIMLGSFDTAVFAPLTGLLALCFAYIGLTQPSRTATAVLPIAATVLVFVNGSWSSAIAIRVVISCVVWAILGELLSHFAGRQAALSAALRTAAHTDVLTGVANRRDLDIRLATAASGDLLVVCDLDHFKVLNDTHGHDAGDRVLADFGTMLRATLRGMDYCARYGGEEFVLVLPATSTADADATLARMRAHWALLQPATTFSAGLAVCRSNRSHAETLAAADRALYAAKAAGRNCNRVECVHADVSDGSA